MNLCTASKLAHSLTVRQLAELIGNLVASMEAKFLQQNKSNFEVKITLSDLSKKELGGKIILW